MHVPGHPSWDNATRMAGFDGWKYTHQEQEHLQPLVREGGVVKQLSIAAHDRKDA